MGDLEGLCVCVCACLRACVCVKIQLIYPCPSLVKHHYTDYTAL